jgi:hypothetical protein
MALKTAPRKPLTPNTLPYRKPVPGRDYWIVDGILPNAADVSARCYAHEDWVLGQPWRNETWPGKRSPNALLPDELAAVEQRVRELTGAKRLWQESVAGDAASNHNHVQVVGLGESPARPHSDSRKLCRYAAVIYLTPNAPRSSGTAFFRLRFPNGGLGGNYCPAPYANLREALNVQSLPLEAWEPDVEIENVFNRLVVYKSELVHSATGYFGTEDGRKRMTAVFFWMAS